MNRQADIAGWAHSPFSRLDGADIEQLVSSVSREAYAHVCKDLGFEFCNAVPDRNPLVAGPLRRTDCSMVSDGAAALVLADAQTAR